MYSRRGTGLFSKKQDIEADDSIFQNVNIEEVSSHLKKDGLFIGLDLSENIVGEILDYARQQLCYGDLNPSWGFFYDRKGEAELKIGKQFLLAHYFNSSTKTSGDRLVLQIEFSLHGYGVQTDIREPASLGVI